VQPDSETAGPRPFFPNKSNPGTNHPNSAGPYAPNLMLSAACRERLKHPRGKVINRYKMSKHFALEITETTFSWTRREGKIAAEAALDGLYVVRTSVPQQRLSTEEKVECYKDLSLVENAFRSLKPVDLKVRPIYHTAAARVQGQSAQTRQAPAHQAPLRLGNNTDEYFIDPNYEFFFNAWTKETWIQGPSEEDAH